MYPFYSYSPLHVMVLLTGHALELQHLRWNTECSVWEELPPIVSNPNYDFNYQQFLYLPREVTILPVRVELNKYYS